MSVSTPPPSPGDSPGRGWLAVAAVALAGIVIGFAGGWVLRGDGGGIDLPVAQAPAPVAEPEVAPPADPPPPEPELPPRDEVGLAVLNGVGVAGAAAEIADLAREAGYVDVTVGDTGPSLEPTTVYHRSERALAARAARDLGIELTRPLPDDFAASDADVVVVLGAG